MIPASANTDKTFVRNLICAHVLVTLLSTSSGILFAFFSEDPELTPEILSLSLLSVRSSVDVSFVFLSFTNSTQENKPICFALFLLFRDILFFLTGLSIFSGIFFIRSGISCHFLFFIVFFRSILSTFPGR